MKHILQAKEMNQYPNYVVLTIYDDETDNIYEKVKNRWD